MNENIKHFVYNNDVNYASYASIKCLMSCVCMFMSLITGTYAIVMKLWHFVAILVIINAAFLLHLLFLKLIYKNTYPMRFLSDWIVDMLLSWLFLNSAFVVLYATKCDTNFVVIGTLISYTTFLLLSIVWMIKRSKSDVYKKYAQMEKNKRPIEIAAVSIVSVSGTIGLVIGRIITRGLDIEKNIIAYVAFVIFIVVSMYFSLGHVNLLKYYYCKKYKIYCDEYGNTTSPNLEYHKKQKRKNIERKEEVLEQTNISKGKSIKKDIPLLIKILIGILAVPIILIFIVFLVFFIKEFIQGIS